MTVRSNIVNQIREEHFRLRHIQGYEPDILLLHPQDLITLQDEMSEVLRWKMSPPKSEFDYGQFYGMDIMLSKSMSPGTFVVGRRVRIERIEVEDRSSQ